jgi:CheY-like chemotaxis protein
MPLVLHVDDEYRNNPRRFKTLREFLKGKGFEVVPVPDFQSVKFQYREKRFPEVIIMDILDLSPEGVYSAPGPMLTELLEDEHAASPESPCIIYYTGIHDPNHKAIKSIKSYNPYTPIVTKTAKPDADAQAIFNFFPERFREPSA